MGENSVIKGLTSLRGFVNFGSLSKASRFSGKALSFSARELAGCHKFRNLNHRSG